MTVKQLKTAIADLPDDTIVRVGRDTGTTLARRVWYHKGRKRIEITEALDYRRKLIYADYDYEKLL